MGKSARGPRGLLVSIAMLVGAVVGLTMCVVLLVVDATPTQVVLVSCTAFWVAARLGLVALKSMKLL